MNIRQEELEHPEQLSTAQINELASITRVRDRVALDLKKETAKKAQKALAKQAIYVGVVEYEGVVAAGTSKSACRRDTQNRGWAVERKRREERPDLPPVRAWLMHYTAGGQHVDNTEVYLNWQEGRAAA